MHILCPTPWTLERYSLDVRRRLCVSARQSINVEAHTCVQFTPCEWVSRVSTHVPLLIKSAIKVNLFFKFIFKLLHFEKKISCFHEVEFGPGRERMNRRGWWSCFQTLLLYVRLRIGRQQQSTRVGRVAELAYNCQTLSPQIGGDRSILSSSLILLAMILVRPSCYDLE